LITISLQTISLFTCILGLRAKGQIQERSIETQAPSRPPRSFVVGIDVGRYDCQLCILERYTGKISEAKVPSRPEAIDAALTAYRNELDKIVIEATSNSFELCRRLIALGLPAALVDARSAAPFLRAYRQAKTDRNDAYGLAQLYAHGAARTVWVRSAASGELGAMLATRDALLKVEVALRNALVSHLDAFGLTIKTRRGANSLKIFDESLARVRGYAFLRSLYEILNHLHTHLRKLNRLVSERARNGADSKLLMTIPGIGPLTALRFISLIDDPKRFAKSRSVGAYLGLVPTVRTSGVSRKLGRLTRLGASELRKSLFLCAQALLTRSRKDNQLREWARRIARRRGTKRAILALARKLAVTMHAVWLSREPYAA
jgi:transposase